MKILRRKFKNIEEKVWKYWGESLKMLRRKFENVEEKVWKYWGESLKILRRIWKLDDFTEFYLFSKSNCHVLSQAIYYQ